MHEAGTRPENRIVTLFVAAIAGLALKPFPRTKRRSWLAVLRASFSRRMALLGAWSDSHGGVGARLG